MHVRSQHPHSGEAPTASAGSAMSIFYNSMVSGQDGRGSRRVWLITTDTPDTVETNRCHRNPLDAFWGKGSQPGAESRSHELGKHDVMFSPRIRRIS